MTGIELKQIRNHLGLSLRDFIDRLGLDCVVSTLWRWEDKGQHQELPLETSNKIAEFMNMTHISLEEDWNVTIELSDAKKLEIIEFIEDNPLTKDSRIVAYECGVDKIEVNKLVQEEYGYECLSAKCREHPHYALLASAEIQKYLTRIVEVYEDNKDIIEDVEKSEMDIWHYIELKLDPQDKDATRFLQEVKQDRIKRRQAKDFNKVSNVLYCVIKRYGSLISDIRKAQGHADSTIDELNKRVYYPRERFDLFPENCPSAEKLKEVLESKNAC